MDMDVDNGDLATMMDTSADGSPTSTPSTLAQSPSRRHFANFHSPKSTSFFPRLPRHFTPTTPPAKSPNSAASTVEWVPPPSPHDAFAHAYSLYRDEDGLWVIYDWKPATTNNSHNHHHHHHHHHQHDNNGTGNGSAPNAPGGGPKGLEPFYQRWPPSRTPSTYMEWICIDRGRRGFSRPNLSKDVEGMQNAFQELIRTRLAQTRAHPQPQSPQANSNIATTTTNPGIITVDDIDTLAKRFNVLSGKWMIHSRPYQVDQLWRRISKMVCFDRKHGSLKVSSRKVDEEPGEDGHPPSHVICVYVDDYTDRTDVDALRDGLRRAGVTWNIGFKPDAYTYLGIYKDNRWGIRPSRYHDADNKHGGHPQQQQQQQTQFGINGQWRRT